MEMSIFASVLRSSEVPLHFRERVCLFHCYGWSDQTFRYG